MAKAIKPFPNIDKSYCLRIFLAVFLPILGCFMLFHLYIYSNKKHHALESLQNDSRHEVALQAEHIEEHFDWLIADLKQLKAVYEKSPYAADASQENLIALATHFSVFCREKQIYDQVRILDSQGMELVRVNYNNGRPVIVPQAQLQNKSKRYYFQEIMALEPGSFYTSGIDLNMENGQVELPHKPMLRLGTQLMDPAGKATGAIVLNYYGAHLLSHLFEHGGRHHQPDNGAITQIMLLNPESYWLTAPVPEDEWAFMFPDRRERNFKNRYPKGWSEISANRSGHLTTEAGIFTYATVIPPGVVFQGGAGYLCKLVSFIPVSRIEKEIYHEKYLFVLIAFLLLVLALSLSFIITLFNCNKRTYQQQLEQMAATDPLTGLLNRRAFLEKFNDEIYRMSRYQATLSLLLGDIDFFKKINDLHGHDAGDFILKQVSRCLQENIRRTDHICRWGGEEFIILLSGDHSVDGPAAAEKLRQVVAAQPIHYKGTDIAVTMSIGVSSFRRGMSIDDCIKHADDNLYRAKKNGRNQVAAH